MNILPIGDTVLVSDMFFGEQLSSSGLIILDDDKKDRGIHPRWCKVYAIGPKNKSDISVGDWILVSHGRWGRGVDLNEIDPKHYEKGQLVIRRVDSKDILLKSKVSPNPKNSIFYGKE